jgi:dTDP-glucose pyrophosphorylase
MQPEILNIVVPMAGRGSRFSKAGYALPKPLLPVHGRPMIERVIENIRPSRPHRFIFICQREHLAERGLEAVLRNAGPGTQIVPIDEVTEGAACTVLLARGLIDDTAPLMIANCDQYISTPMDHYLAAMDDGAWDGFIMTMTADDPKWSFVKLDDHGRVTQVVEKKVVSNEATVGIYNFRHGADFVAAADAMMAAGDRTNGEFYVAPAYNYLWAGQRTGFLNIGSERAGMYGLGIPDDLSYFNALPELPVAEAVAA